MGRMSAISQYFEISTNGFDSKVRDNEFSNIVGVDNQKIKKN